MLIIFYLIQKIKNTSLCNFSNSLILLARQMSPKNSSRIIGYLTAFYAAGQMIGATPFLGLVGCFRSKSDKNSCFLFVFIPFKRWERPNEDTS